MRVYRVVRSNPPTEADFRSPVDAGKLPPKNRPSRTWKAVSSFIEFDKAVDKAAAYDLGDFIAALEIPDTVQATVSDTGHVDLEDTTPGELLGYVVQVSPREARVTT